MTRLAVVTACDDAYCIPACVLLCSLGTAGGMPRDIQVIVLAVSLSQESARALKEAARRANLNADLRFADDARPLGEEERRFPRASFLRLWVGEMCRDFDRVVYLDADTVVLRPINELLEARLEPHHVGAVIDSLYPTIASAPGLRRFANTVLPPNAPYFNSGVLAIDVAWWRGQQVGERAGNFVLQFRDELEFPDQDALNAVLYDAWCPLDSRWNVCPAFIAHEIVSSHAELSHLRSAGLEKFEESEAAASVLHFVGSKKPWREDFPPSHVKDLYESFMRRT
jgi:lipopolysaccharide biosynthesis glycosyltransferase